MDTQVIVAIIGLSGLVGSALVGGFWATLRYYKSEREKNEDEERARLAERDKRLDERERAFWERAEKREAENEKRVNGLEARLDAQDAVIKEQAATIQAQGALLMQHRDRIRELESTNSKIETEKDHWKQRAELAERKNTGGKRI